MFRFIFILLIISTTTYSQNSKWRSIFSNQHKKRTLQKQHILQNRLDRKPSVRLTNHRTKSIRESNDSIWKKFKKNVVSIQPFTYFKNLNDYSSEKFPIGIGISYERLIIPHLSVQIPIEFAPNGTYSKAGIHLKVNFGDLDSFRFSLGHLFYVSTASVNGYRYNSYGFVESMNGHWQTYGISFGPFFSFVFSPRVRVGLNFGYGLMIKERYNFDGEPVYWDASKWDSPGRYGNVHSTLSLGYSFY